MAQNKNPTVWSSEIGDLRKQDGKTTSVIPQSSNVQTAYLHRDSKGRGGKSVTLVKNLLLAEKDMKELAKMLKQICGTGGTVKDGVIEIQGEHREKLASALQKLVQEQGTI